MERRPSGRAPNALRPVTIEPGVQRGAAGSVLITQGGTRVVCAASVEEKVAPWLTGKGRGWVTAEYAMLPASGGKRSPRGPNSRATEIQRLVGRALRIAVDLSKMPGLTITVDCDVLEADGGTRTASITGGYVALHLACAELVRLGKLAALPLVAQVAAVSAGIVGGTPILDLDYLEDSSADVDMNVVGLADGRLVEVQGTAEHAPFDARELNAMVDLAQAGIRELVALQSAALRG